MLRFLFSSFLRFKKKRLVVVVDAARVMAVRLGIHRFSAHRGL